MWSRQKVKSWLLVTHRTLGVAGCVLFLLWFASGLVMMYVEMPYLLRSDAWLDGVEPLAPVSGELLRPAAVVERASSDSAGPIGTVGKLYLDMLGGAPVWHLEPASGRVITVDASSGDLLGPFDAAAGKRSAALWRDRAANGSDGSLRFEETLELDQWTLYSGLFARHRPLHRFTVEGSRGTEIYVSSATGQVVQTTTRRERVLGYLGPVTHWIYPTFIRQHGRLWSNLVIVVSGLGTLAVLCGLVLGIWNLRRPNAKHGLSPYTARWMRWHHLFGLGFGAATLVWIFSGLMSMAPFGWAPSTSPSGEQVARWSGSGASGWQSFAVSPVEALGAFAPHLEVKRLEARVVGGSPWWVAFETPKKSLALRATGALANDTVPRAEIPESVLEHTAAGLVPGAQMVEWQRLDEYDDYYYSKKSFRNTRRLPVYRASYNDRQRTTLYIDPHAGAIVRRMEALSRLERYLYNGLHSWDIGGFWNRRPLWDLVVGFFMLGGLFVSLTSVVLGVRVLVRKRRQRRRRKERAGDEHLRAS